MSHIVRFYGRTRKEHNFLNLVVSWCLVARYVLGLQARNNDTRKTYVRPLIYRARRKSDIVYDTPISRRAGNIPPVNTDPLARF